MAALGGTRVADWIAERAATLRSVGKAVEELRSYGVAIDVAHRTGQELGDPAVDRIITVEHLHRDGYTVWTAHRG